MQQGTSTLFPIGVPLHGSTTFLQVKWINLCNKGSMVMNLVMVFLQKYFFLVREFLFSGTFSRHKFIFCWISTFV